ncbi:hypothetical protein PG996_016072 [Apiospora saccharicola]|uniref:Homing endonuclease LAGLIDADG domain-containing protein n=1 Tax=Apiospora saccharicola TaxID=335842 RepID=A0ABR1TN15_9PEZI
MFITLSSEKFDIVSQVVKFAYGTNSNTYAPLRSIFLRFIVVSGTRVIDLDQFLALIDSIPVLGNAIVKAGANRYSHGCVGIRDTAYAMLALG